MVYGNPNSIAYQDKYFLFLLILMNVLIVFAVYQDSVVKGFSKWKTNEIKKFKQKALLHSSRYTIGEIYEALSPEHRNQLMESLYDSSLRESILRNNER